MRYKLSTLLALSILIWANATAQTFTSVYLNTPTLVSSTNGALKPGALYKYANAAGSSGNYIDAYIQIVKTSNTGSDAVGLFAFDNSASVNNPGGYTSAFQPVTSCSGTNSSGLWTSGGQCGNGYVQLSYSANQNYLVHFRLYFKKAGTQTDTALNIHAAFIDIDGFGGYTTEAEQDAFMPPYSYAVAPGTTLTITQRSDGLYNAEGQHYNVGGIQLTTTTALTQVTYLNRTFIDFAIGMNTHSANAHNGCYDAVAGGRLASVSFASQPSGCTVVTTNSIALSGTVWDDADGSANGTFSNIRTNSEPGTSGGGLYVYALDSASETVLGKATVASNGTWSISGLPQDMPVKLVLSNLNVNVGVTNGSPTGILNTNWVATSPLTRPAFRPTATTSNLDFGIEQLPSGANYTASTQLNPGGTNRVTVPSAAFTGTDPEDGTYPVGLTGRKVALTPGTNGNLYYNGTLVTTTTSYTAFDPTKVTIDPTGPMPTAYVAVTSTFTYSVYDNAGRPSAATTVTLPLDAALCINLRVYLEGSLRSNGNAVASDGRPLMRDNLRSSPFTSARYIPGRDPYEFRTQYVNVVNKYTKLAPQNSSHPEFQQVTDSTNVFAVTGQNAIVDWVFVELRNKSNNAQVIATRAGLLQRDGDVVDVDGVSCLSFPGVPIDSYYVAIRHRSHLGTMTKYAQSATNLQSLVDFTVTTTPLYDKGTVGLNNFTGLSEKNNAKGTYRAMWQGDFNADGKVKYDNPNDDLSVMLSNVVNYPTNTDLATNFDFAYGYMQGDYDMNSKVKYDNPNDDNSSLLSTLVNYPLNVDLATNFDFFIQQLP